MSYQVVTYDYYGREVKAALNLFVPKIKQRQAYEINGRLYKTRGAAAKKLAWHLILTKYPDIENVRALLGVECDCADEDEHSDYGVQYKHEACQLHSRHDGYFKRLHGRLVDHILKTWKAEDE